MRENSIPQDVFDKAYAYAQAHNREIYASHFDPELEFEYPKVGDRCYFSYTPPRDGAAYVVDPAGVWNRVYNLGEV